MPLRSWHKRRQYFVDSKVQGGLMLRCCIYWVFCLGAIFSLLLCWHIWHSPANLFYNHMVEAWLRYGPMLLASLVLLPLMLVDLVRVSNRFAGPMVRLRQSMQDLAEGKPTQPIQFREGDHWQEFAQHFNAIRVRMESRQPTTTREPPAELHARVG